MTKTEDPPITTEELAYLHWIRIGKPESRAARQECYGDPAKAGVRFESELPKEKARHKDRANKY